MHRLENIKQPNPVNPIQGKLYTAVMLVICHLHRQVIKTWFGRRFIHRRSGKGYIQLDIRRLVIRGRIDQIRTPESGQRTLRVGSSYRQGNAGNSNDGADKCTERYTLLAKRGIIDDASNSRSSAADAGTVVIRCDDLSHRVRYGSGIRHAI